MQASAERRRRSRELLPTGTGDAVGHSSQVCSPSIPEGAVPPAMTRRKSDPAPYCIDSLAQELSRQNLQLDQANLERLQMQLSAPPLSLRISPISAIAPCPEPEIDVERPPIEELDAPRRWPAGLPPLPAESMEIDRRPTDTDTKRPSWQRGSQSTNSSNPNNNPRTIQALVEDMIASGSQCNVHSASPPPPTPTSAKRLGQHLLEPDNYGDGDSSMKIDVDCLALQVDEAYANGPTSDTEREEAFLMEAMSLRRAGQPAGVRKLGLLHYRASADAALSCANVVRSRPRMRKRARTHRSSKTSSVMSSAFSSPVVPPSLDDNGSPVPLRELGI